MNDYAVDGIFRQAQCAPNKAALHYLGNRVTYGEFAYWISLAQDFFARQDLRPGSVAALVYVPDVFDGWVLRFALRSLGLTTVDFAAPEQLAAHKLKNLGCVITTIRDQPIDIPDADYKLVRIPTPIFSGNQAGPVPEMPPRSGPQGGHILMTSGTTGYRKKVLRDAASLSNEIKRRCELFSISENSVVHAFDFAPWAGTGLFSPACAWRSGGTVIFHQGKNLHRSFQIERITHAIVTPMKLEELLASPEADLRFHPELQLIVGGAPLTAALARAAKSRLTPNVIHYLTSTEGGPLALTRIEGPDDLKSHLLLPDADLQIVNDADQPLPPGNVGVIRVRPTDGLTGYWDDEEASWQFFRDGYFYPGDLGEIRSDGRLVLHGRTTTTINLGGEKRPVEILEQRLQDRLGADGICLISVPGRSQEDELYILVQSRQPFGEDEVMRALALVAYLGWVPEAHVQHVQSIPRNEMGKIDRPAVRHKISSMLPGRTSA
jgi:acyl-coenzyme A synthetase/AMP-(fatty) acid ligase